MKTNMKYNINVYDAQLTLALILLMFILIATIFPPVKQTIIDIAIALK